MTDETTTNEQVANLAQKDAPATSPNADGTKADVVTPENDAESGTANTAETPTTEVQDENPQGDRSRARERIEDLVAERNAAKEYAEYWRGKSLELMQTSRPQNEQQTQVEEAQETSAPTLEQFKGDQSKWSKAHAEWTDKTINIRTAKALQAQEQQRVQMEALGAFETKIEKFKESHPDFDIVVANPKLPTLDRTASAMIVASDYSADITYTLAKDPSLAVRIARMGPSQQALAIGRLEAQVSSKEVKVPKIDPAVNPTPSLAKPTVKPVTTKAPPPPEPVTSGGIPDTSPEGMDIRDWMQSRREEARQRRRR